MTDTTVPDSALGQRLIADMDAVNQMLHQPKAVTQGQTWLDVEREQEKSRILTNYVAYLLDRVEKLDNRPGSE